jgi:hypothetical protein
MHYLHPRATGQAQNPQRIVGDDRPPLKREHAQITFTNGGA